MSTTEYYDSVAQLVMIYLGIPILIIGLIGDTFILIVFLSLKTFRENACAFYLTVMAAADTGQLITGLLSRVMISGFGVDWTLYSIFYCKFRRYCLQFCALTSFVCMCLAAINQFLATSASPHWQQWSHIKIAHRVIIIFIIIWLLQGIPFLIYYDHLESPITGKITCMSSRIILQQYYVNGITLTLAGFLPIIIDAIFAVLAYCNMQKVDQRALPVVQRELHKQMTAIVLIQFIYHTIVNIPYLISTIINEDTTLQSDSLTAAKLQIFSNLATCIYYFNYAVS